MMSGDLVYSNDTCSAFLTSIVRSFQEKHPTRYLGRTAVQKLTYFAKALAVPIPCSFDIYTYGPYSDAVTFSMDSLMADDVVVDRSYNPSYSNYRPGPNSEHLLASFQNDIGPYTATIDRVVEAFGEFGPNQLELIATIHFIAGRQRQILRQNLDKRTVIEEFKAIKGEKFSDEEINSWYDALNTAGLI